jgi:hypothetical protein
MPSCVRMAWESCAPQAAASFNVSVAGRASTVQLFLAGLGLLRCVSALTKPSTPLALIS